MKQQGCKEVANQGHPILPNQGNIKQDVVYQTLFKVCDGIQGSVRTYQSP